MGIVRPEGSVVVVDGGGRVPRRVVVVAPAGPGPGGGGPSGSDGVGCPSCTTGAELSPNGVAARDGLVEVRQQRSPLDALIAGHDAPVGAVVPEAEHRPPPLGERAAIRAHGDGGADECLARRARRIDVRLVERGLGHERGQQLPVEGRRRRAGRRSRLRREPTAADCQLATQVDGVAEVTTVPRVGRLIGDGKRPIGHEPRRRDDRLAQRGHMQPAAGGIDVEATDIRGGAHRQSRGDARCTASHNDVGHPGSHRERGAASLRQRVAGEQLQRVAHGDGRSPPELEGAVVGQLDRRRALYDPNAVARVQPARAPYYAEGAVGLGHLCPAVDDEASLARAQAVAAACHQHRRKQQHRDRDRALPHSPRARCTSASAENGRNG